MKLEEILRLGHKKFKRVEHAFWKTRDKESLLIYPSELLYTITNLDVLATDWEYEEESITITRSQAMEKLGKLISTPTLIVAIEGLFGEQD